MRVLILTGKGGVGKTTIAAATALRAAELGHRTLVVSTDPAHSLGDSLERQLGNTTVKIAENLWAQEINILHEITANWQVIRDYMASFFKSTGISNVLAEEMAVLPGTDELFGLLRIHQAHESGEYDCLVVDCAPTGQTLRLLSFPEVARWWMQKIFPVERTIAKTLRAMRKRTIFSLPIPEDVVYSSLQELFDKTGALNDLLQEPRITSVRIVLNPERIVLEETQRAYTYLNLYGYPVDCVITNRVLPEEVTDTYFSEWRQAQSRYMEKAQRVFSPLPMLQSRLMRGEVVGPESLARIGREIYGDEDPTRVYYEGRPQHVDEEDDSYVLVLKLPFAKNTEVEVIKDDGELTVQIGNYRRDILLPGMLAGLMVGHAKLKADELRITFPKETAS